MFLLTSLEFLLKKSKKLRTGSLGNEGIPAIGKIPIPKRPKLDAD